MAELHIASCVARIRPEAIETAIAQIEAAIGGAISARDANTNNKVIVVMEGESTGSLLDQMDKIRDIPGVVNIEMVYQHAEEQSIMEETLV